MKSAAATLLAAAIFALAALVLSDVRHPGPSPSPIRVGVVVPQPAHTPTPAPTPATKPGTVSEHPRSPGKAGAATDDSYESVTHTVQEYEVEHT